MVEKNEDKSIVTGRFFNGAKLLKFELLKVHCQVTDHFDHKQDLIFMWDNHRDSEARILAKLD